MIDKDVALTLFYIFMTLKLEGAKGSILRSPYYYLEYFEIFCNSEDQDNDFNNPEKPARYMIY